MISDPEFLTGYLDSPSYSPGEVIRVHSSSTEQGTVRLVKLLHGDTNPAGPGFLQQVVHSVTREVPAVQQNIRPGSWGHLTLDEEQEADQFTVTVWAWPTSDSGILVEVGADDGRSLIIESVHGRLGVRVRDCSAEWSGATPILLRERQWQFVSVAVTRNSATVSVVEGDSEEEISLRLPPKLVPETIRRVALAASAAGSGQANNCFNGKLEAPTIWAGTPGADETRLPAEEQADNLCQLLAIDFGDDPSSVWFKDTVSGARGELMNMPTRGVTGRRWKGQVESWQHHPGLYSAVHFHSDDLADAQWDVTASFPLPRDLPSGMYALWLVTENYQDWLTFIVTRAPGQKPKPLLILIPTLTYLSYANEPIFHPHTPMSRDARDDWVERNRLISQYNWHGDGSGVAFASWRRPLMNLRPDYRYWLTGHPHGPGADLYLLHWLDSMGFEYDLTTDHQLAQQGTRALSEYHVLVSGCHPEYWTVGMLQTLDHFQQRAGRFAYLGGNGLAAVVAIHKEQPWVSEMRRRGASGGLWDADPGESYFASDGGVGGLTRHQSLRGRELIGVDITGMGFSEGQPFKRTKESNDPRTAFIFKGVDSDVIGDFGLHMGGAAGYEVDSADQRTGTPPHALVIASCTTIPPHYVRTEQRGVARADMVFFETPSGGAVFSASSITWTGSLSHNAGRNDVARITENVLRRFLDESPFQYSRDLGMQPQEPSTKNGK